MSKSPPTVVLSREEESREVWRAQLAPRVAQTLRAAAEARQTTEVALAARLLSVVCRDKLIDAVLDDQEPRAASRKLDR